MKTKLVLILIFFVSHLQAQVLTGTVRAPNEQGKLLPLPGANVYWQNTTEGTSTNAEGKFSLNIPVVLPHQLIISFVGYNTDTINVLSPTDLKIELKPIITLKQAEVVKRKEATTISTMKPLNTQTIGKKELLKAACCNLSESFETNPAVDVNYTDAVTGTKEIKLLGLSGIYTQLLAENIPTLRGLAAPYGLTYIPGTWMESIQVTKGSGPVVNGYESLTGSINIEFLKPEELDHKYHLDFFASDEARFEANAYAVKKLNEKWSTMLLVHGDYNQLKLDMNDDSFMDMPLVKNINAYSRWRYHSGKKLEGQFGLKVISEQRDGGQVDFDKATDYGSTNHWGLQAKTNRAELYTKTGLIYPEKPWKSMGLQTNWLIHDMKSFMGLRNYDAIQKSIYANYIYQSIIKTTAHKFKTGASFLLDNYDEHYNEPTIKYERYITYIVPGVFGEYTYEQENKLTVVAGMRFDYHNYEGMFYTPRVHAKYNFTDKIIMRASIGKSYRTANVISDNFGLLASSKILKFNEELNAEEAWNGGLNLTWKFKMMKHDATFNADAYRTQFVNQVIVDPYSNSNYIQVYNLNGKSFSQNFQVSLDYELIKNLDLRLAYKWDNVKVTYDEVLRDKPLVSHNKALLNLAYNFANDKWRADFTTQWIGEKPLEYVHDNPSAETGNSNYSPNYFILNAQITKVFRHFEIYLGGENLTDFRQQDVIISADDPFSKTFDATDVWGPVTGRKIYAGFRTNFK